MKYLISSFVGLVVGAMIGAVLGPISDVLLQTTLYHARVSQGVGADNLLRMRTTLFALGGAVVLGMAGLFIGLAIAFLRRPKARPSVPA